MSLSSTGSANAPAIADACFDWQQRHGARTARDGGIFPDVHIRRFRDKAEISWKSSHLAGADDVSFLATGGVVRDDLNVVAGALHEMLTSASAWLHAQVPDSQRCASLVESVEALQQPQRSEERAAWLAGLGDTRKEFLSRWRSLRHRVSKLGSPQAVEAVFGRSSSGGVVLDGCLAPLLDEVGDDFAASNTNLEAWLADWRVRVSTVALDDSELRAVSFASANHAPQIVLNENHRSAHSAPARRFTLAHELCHLLYDRSVGASLAVASGPWAPIAIEGRANAFAAWLLMPPDRLSSAIAWAPSAVNTPEGLASVAARLDVSKTALVEHLGNLGHLSEDDRNQLRFDL